MFYSPKHAAVRSNRTANRAAGVALVGAASVGAGLATASSASAYSVWDGVAACESGGNWAINTGNGFYGGLQFSYSTWLGYGGGAYARTANGASRAAQITVAQRVLASQGPGAWPVCSVRAGLTRANGGAASASAPATVSRSATRTYLWRASSFRASADRLVVDGIRGPKTNAAIHRWIGRPGRSGFTVADTRAFEAKVRGSVNGSFGSDDVRRLQAIVGADVDGIWGPQTTTYLQRYLNRAL